jgi:NTP pyrophosphatase (non-canonical NTP hydrolase)
MAKSLNQLIDQVADFSERRNWRNTNPNQLISSTLIELGELAEHFQWKNEFKEYSDEEKLEIGYEMMDVLFYLFRLASKADIDLDKAFADKIKKLEVKYPVGSDWQTQHDKYRKSGKNKRYE